LVGLAFGFGEDDCLMEHLQATTWVFKSYRGQTCKLILVLIPAGSVFWPFPH